jgi:hypothetical protein
VRVRFLKLERTLSGSRDPASSSCHENDNHVTMMSTCRAKKKSTDFKIFFELRKKPDLNYFIERIIGQSVVTTVERRFAFSVKREKKKSFLNGFHVTIHDGIAQSVQCIKKWIIFTVP